MQVQYIYIYIYTRIYTRIYAPISRWMNVYTYIHTYLHVTLVITLRLGNGRPCKLFHGVTTAYVLRVWVGGDSGENKKLIPSPPNIKPPRNHGLVRISYRLDLFGTIQWWGLILMGMGLCYIKKIEKHQRLQFLHWTTSHSELLQTPSCHCALAPLRVLHPCPLALESPNGRCPIGYAKSVVSTTPNKWTNIEIVLQFWADKTMASCRFPASNNLW